MKKHINIDGEYRWCLESNNDCIIAILEKDTWRVNWLGYLTHKWDQVAMYKIKLGDNKKPRALESVIIGNRTIWTPTIECLTINRKVLDNLFQKYIDVEREKFGIADCYERIIKAL